MDVQVTGLCLSDSLPLLGMSRSKHFPFVLMWQFIVLAACRISSAGLAAEEFTSVFYFIVLQNSGQGGQGGEERGTLCL